MKQLVCYVTAALPEESFTEELIIAMSESGVDIIELGIPFSDPVADGNIIAQANLQALKDFNFESIAKIAKTIHPFIPTFVMSYANPLYFHKIQNVCASFAKNGVCGLIIPDVPFEESAFYQKYAHNNGLCLVPFIAPTTPKERMKLLLANVASKAFVYVVAYAGITGAHKEQDLTALLENAREYTKTPLFVGFGVDVHNAAKKAQGADGVIVGSAIVKILISDLPRKDKIARICDLCTIIKDKINS